MKRCTYTKTCPRPVVRSVTMLYPAGKQRHHYCEFHWHRTTLDEKCYPRTIPSAT